MDYDINNVEVISSAFVITCLNSFPHLVCESTSLLTNSALMDSVSASPSVPSSGLNMLVDGGSEEWCTDEEINGTFYFQLQFVCPVSLAYMQVKGFEQEEEIGFQTGYVRKFTLEVGDGSGDFTTYNITNTLVRACVRT